MHLPLTAMSPVVLSKMSCAGRTSAVVSEAIARTTVRTKSFILMVLIE